MNQLQRCNNSYHIIISQYRELSKPVILENVLGQFVHIDISECC